MKKIRNFTRSLAFNAIGGILAVIAIISLIVGIIGYNSFTSTLAGVYEKYAYSAALTARESIDAEYLYSCIENKRENPDFTPDIRYDRMRATLQLICDAHDLTFIYAIDPKAYDEYNKFDVLIETVNSQSTFAPWTLGLVNDTTPEYKEIYRSLYKGETDRGFITRTRSNTGAHTTSVIPLMVKGQVRALLCVQLKMSLIDSEKTVYLATVIITSLVLLAIFITFSLVVIKRNFLSPIKTVENEAKRFAAENKAPERLLSEKVKTKINEIKNLADSIDHLEQENLEYIESMTKMTSENQRISTELRVAKVIQESALPSVFPAFPNRKDFDIFASMTPAKEVGGDFYDFYFIDNDHLALVMADVSGKGIPAALYMMISKVLIGDRALMDGKPSEILSFVNNRICENNVAQMFVTAWLGILELSTGKLMTSNAGHEDPLIFRKGEGFSFSKERHSLVLGAMSDVVYRDHEYTLKPGDKLFLYTDGVTEATNSENELFGSERLLQSVNSSDIGKACEIIQRVKTDVDEFVGDAPQFDDLTVLCITIPEKEGNEKEKTFPAELSELDNVLAFVNECAGGENLSPKTEMQLSLCVEELFVNVASYAYGDGKGDVTFRASLEDGVLSLSMIDSGKPYNPLEKPDPDITLSANERPIGGLGIFIVKKHMDSVEYKYEGGKNILSMTKRV